MLKVSWIALFSSAIALGSAYLPARGYAGEHSVTSAPANANTQDKRIYFILGPLIRSISVSDLEIFAGKGIARGDIGNILNFGKLEPQNLRDQLNKEYLLDFVAVSQALNDSVGVALLSKLGEGVHPLRNKATSVQALRSALVMSLEDDNALTPLEVLKNLPVDMAVEIDVILKMKDELTGLFPQE
jgi:hypothetical protein